MAARHRKTLVVCASCQADIHGRRSVCPSIHGVVTGERRAVKVACVVRAGGRGKRTCSAGTSPTAHQYSLA
ncbi:hypothetical protein ACFC4G_41495 [Streptomyces sp. NPDC056002]|uniref:hypothetical protein n=1 Tax=Streptomyces sp. NPDC056002 TaxID=3345675 RepID=UPI0035DD5736